MYIDIVDHEKLKSVYSRSGSKSIFYYKTNIELLPQLVDYLAQEETGFYGCDNHTIDCDTQSQSISYNMMYLIIPQKIFDSIRLIFISGSLIKNIPFSSFINTDNIKIIRYEGEDCYKFTRPLELIFYNADKKEFFFTKNFYFRLETSDQKFVKTKIQTMIKIEHAGIITDINRKKDCDMVYIKQNKKSELFAGFKLKVRQYIDELEIKIDNYTLKLEEHDFPEHSICYDRWYQYKLHTMLVLYRVFIPEIARHILNFITFPESNIEYWIPIDFESSLDEIKPSRCWKIDNQDFVLEATSKRKKVAIHDIKYFYLEQASYYKEESYSTSIVVRGPNNPIIRVRNTLPQNYHPSGYHYIS